MSAEALTESGPTRHVTSADGACIAVFTSDAAAGPPVVLVHGTGADHTTFRVVGPLLEQRFAVHAIDRRGRGASGDGPAYAIEREFEDVAAVVDAVARERGRPVDVIGHSFGGRCGLGAALRTGHIRRLVVYEGAPTPDGSRYVDRALADELRALIGAGRPDEALETFLRAVVAMDDAAIGAYRANPVWPARVAAAGTIARELQAERGEGGGLGILGGVRVPVLQILGGDSLPVFRTGVEALHARLADGRVVVIPGARHAAHHTHPEAFVDAVTRFLLPA